MHAVASVLYEVRESWLFFIILFIHIYGVAVAMVAEVVGAVMYV